MANTANAEWKGDLKGGRGHFEIADGRLAGDYSFKSRFEGENDAGANPEELIAAAHASCFSMALSGALGEHGHEPESLKTTAEVTLKVGSDGPKIVKVALHTVGKVPGIDAEHFAKHAEEAKENCPVSKALAGVDEITLETEFTE